MITAFQYGELGPTATVCEGHPTDRPFGDLREERREETQQTIEQFVLFVLLVVSACIGVGLGTHSDSYSQYAHIFCAEYEEIFAGVIRTTEANATIGFSAAGICETSSKSGRRTGTKTV